MLYGIGNYTMGASDDAGRQASSGGGGGGGGDSATAIIGAISHGIVGITDAVRGASAPAPAVVPATSGGGLNLGGAILPIAAVALVVVGGYLVVKKMRRGRR